MARRLCIFHIATRQSLWDVRVPQSATVSYQNRLCWWRAQSATGPGRRRFRFAMDSIIPDRSQWQQSTCTEHVCEQKRNAFNRSFPAKLSVSGFGIHTLWLLAKFNWFRSNLTALLKVTQRTHKVATNANWMPHKVVCSAQNSFYMRAPTNRVLPDSGETRMLRDCSVHQAITQTC